MSRAALLPLAIVALAVAPMQSFGQTAKPGASTPGAATAAKGAPAPKGGKSSSVAILPGGNSKEPVNIEANKLEWFDKDQKAVYTGNVVVVQGETSLRASVLTIFLARDAANAGAADQPAAPSANSQIRKMEAAGPVTVIQKDQIGTGDRGEYDKLANKVYLYGNVTLSQGPNITTGDKLTYDLDTKQAVVESGASKSRVQGIFVPGSGGKDGDPLKPGKPGDAKPKGGDAAKPARPAEASNAGRPVDLQAPRRTP